MRYVDYVQQHAIADFISRVNAPLTIVEVGAHHGGYAVILGKLLGSLGGRVIAIEPNPFSFEILKKNVSMNGLEDVVTCVHGAISDTPGILAISDKGIQSQLVAHGEGAEVTVMTLAQVVRDYALSTVDLLIIDVEGAELPVLKGFPWSMLPFPRIFCELHPYAWPDFGYSGADFQQFLSSRQLRCIDMYLTEHLSYTQPDYIGPTVLIK